MKILNNLLKFSINQLLIIEENIIQKILALWKSNNVFPSLIYVQDYFPAGKIINFNFVLCSGGVKKNI